MIRGILIAILGIAIVGTSYWGYKEHQEKDAVLLHAENNYQRAFHDLTYQVDQLHDQIGSTLAMNSKNAFPRPGRSLENNVRSTQQCQPASPYTYAV